MLLSQLFVGANNKFKCRIKALLDTLEDIGSFKLLKIYKSIDLRVRQDKTDAPPELYTPRRLQNTHLLLLGEQPSEAVYTSDN